MSALRLRSLATLALASLTLSACGDSANSESGDVESSGALDVVTSFYPLEFVTNRIVGDLATVETLTSPGVDPHDTELSPQSVAGVKQADLVIYSSGLQAAVDQAVEGQAMDHSLDVNDSADLIEVSSEDEHDHGDDEAHTEEGGHDEDEHDHGATDPHFWLDPDRLADVSTAIAERLAQIDPDNADSYQANAEDLVGQLSTLKDEYRTGLASCSQQDMITTHEAFGYIAEPYGFNQIGITGLEPNSEPSAARLAEVSAIVKESGATTVYSEILLGAATAQTVANETGAGVKVLDPVEGVTDASPGEDYIEIMRANLEVLREGQGCS